jgi:drug/metabolite transporter (DMT)-like permease
VSHQGKTWTALVTVYVIWGSTYLGIAIAGETIAPLFAVSTRFVTAGALLAGLVVLRGGTLRLTRRTPSCSSRNGTFPPVSPR